MTSPGKFSFLVGKIARQIVTKKHLEIGELCKGVHCADLGESFQMSISLQTLASIQPRTILVKFARSPSTDPPGDNFASHIFSARTAKHVPRRRREEHKEKRYVQLQKYDCGTFGMLEAISAVMSLSQLTEHQCTGTSPRQPRSQVKFVPTEDPIPEAAAAEQAAPVRRAGCAASRWSIAALRGIGQT